MPSWKAEHPAHGASRTPNPLLIGTPRGKGHRIGEFESLTQVPASRVNVIRGFGFGFGTGLVTVYPSRVTPNSMSEVDVKDWDPTWVVTVPLATDGKPASA